MNTRGQMESKAAESDSPLDRWTEYWQGAVILSLLITGLAFFSANAGSPLQAGLLCAVAFFLSYPCTRFVSKLTGNDLLLNFIAGIVSGGGVLAAYIFYGMVLGFARLSNIKRFFKACPEGWHLPTGGEWMILIHHARCNLTRIWDLVSHAFFLYFWKSLIF